MSNVDETKERRRMSALIESGAIDPTDPRAFSARRGSMQTFAEAVALDVLPDETSPEKGFDFVTILEIVVAIVQTVIQRCPAPVPQIKNGIRRPNIFQRAAILKQTQDTCACMGMGRYAGRIHRALVARGPALAEVDIDAILQLAQDDGNLLI